MLSSWLVWILFVAVVVPLLAPIFVKLTLHPKARQVFEYVDVARTPFPSEVDALVAEHVSCLERVGFRVAAHLKREQHLGMSDMTTYVVMLTKADEQTLAMLATSIATSKGVPPLHSYFTAFTTDFADGASVETGNLGQPEVLASPPGLIKTCIPEVRDAVRLHEIHRAICARRRPIARKPIPADEQLAEYVAADIARGMAHQEAVGYFRLDSSGETYRPTWRGAALMTFRAVPPFCLLAKWRRSRENAELLRELGV
jgi:hypothetical protein